jgi:pilus assembly protein CpaB
MNTRSLVIAIGALFIAVIAAVVARNLFAGASTPTTIAAPVKETKTKVVVALKALPTGKILTLEDIKFASWPEDAVDPTFYRQGTAELASLTGKVVRAQVLAGQPLSNTLIIGPGERGFLAAVLKPGMRAVSVSVNMTSGVGGFIFPGDRVDMILTHEVPNGNGLPLRGSETILTNVRVLAMNQLTNDTEKTPQSPNTVTVEVQPKFVELINVAQRLGALSLSLQPISSNQDDVAVTKSADTNTSGAQQKDAKLTKVLASTDSESPVMPDVQSRSVTIDREFSKLVTMAKNNGGQNQQGAQGGAPTAGAAAPAKPDMVIGRGDAAEKIFFKQPSQ